MISSMRSRVISHYSTLGLASQWIKTCTRSGKERLQADKTLGQQNHISSSLIGLHMLFVLRLETSYEITASRRFQSWCEKYLHIDGRLEAMRFHCPKVSSARKHFLHWGVQAKKPWQVREETATVKFLKDAPSVLSPSCLWQPESFASWQWPWFTPWLVDVLTSRWGTTFLNSPIPPSLNGNQEMKQEQAWDRMGSAEVVLQVDTVRSWRASGLLGLLLECCCFREEDCVI